MSEDEDYRLRTEARLSTLETKVEQILLVTNKNADTVEALERVFARYQLLMPALSGALFVIGLLAGLHLQG